MWKHLRVLARRADIPQENPVKRIILVAARLSRCPYCYGDGRHHVQCPHF